MKTQGNWNLVGMLVMVILLSSCDSDPEPKQIDVYLGGHYFNENAGTSGIYQAAYWKNGKMTIISNGAGFVQQVAVSDDGKDFYAFGRTDDDAASKTIWKNGVATNMLSAVTGLVSFYDMGVHDGDIYVVGSEYDESVYKPKVWINGESKPLGDGIAEGAASEIISVGGDLYILGWISAPGGYKIVYWKNGEMTIVTPVGTNQFAFSMGVSGNNVYILGAREDVYGIWKNGTFTALSGEDPEFWGYPGQLLVKGSDVYVFGEDIDLVKNEYQACYWKNDVRTFVESTGDYSTIISAAMTSKGIYAVGYEDYDGSDWNSAVWHNWEIQEPIFLRSARNAYTESIAVAEY